MIYFCSYPISSSDLAPSDHILICITYSKLILAYFNLFLALKCSQMDLRPFYFFHRVQTLLKVGVINCSLLRGQTLFPRLFSCLHHAIIVDKIIKMFDHVSTKINEIVQKFKSVFSFITKGATSILLITERFYGFFPLWTVRI